MDNLISSLNANPIIALFVIIGSGIALGNINIRGMSLGSTGVIFTGILFGHLGVQLPHDIRTLGVILFVYAVGLQAGPRFFRTIHHHGVTYLFIVIISLLLSACSVWSCVHFLGVNSALGIGIYPGALTSSPGLAAAMEINKDPNLSIGYGIAYPFAIIEIIIFTQIIAMRKKTREEVQNAIEQHKFSDEAVQTKHYLVTNPNFTGKPIAEINLHSMTKANLTRVKRGDRVIMVYGDQELQLKDIVRAVGTRKELQKLEHLIGSEIQADLDHPQNLVSRDVYITSSQYAGKMIRDLEIHSLFGVILTRLQRDEMEIVPTGETMLETGDLVRIVGDQDDCELFVKVYGQAEKRIHETNLLPLAVGIVLGALLGGYYFSLPGGFKVHLGMSGGPLLVALIVSHYGRIGRLRTRIPYAAKFLFREIGLVFFLASAGTEAGRFFWEILKQTGFGIVLIGMLTTLIPTLAAYLLSVYVFKLGNLAAIGVVCGTMTMTPVLTLINSKLDSDAPSIPFTAIYPIAMVIVTVFSQILAMIFS